MIIMNERFSSTNDFKEKLFAQNKREIYTGIKNTKRGERIWCIYRRGREVLV